MMLPAIISGTVIAGAGVARRFGYPTANLEVGALELNEGVYLGRTSGEDLRSVPSVIFYGTPHALPKITVPRFEINLLDQSVDLYGKIITVHIEHFVRPNKKFATDDELSKAIASDFTAARDYFHMNRHSPIRANR